MSCRGAAAGPALSHSGVGVACVEIFSDHFKFSNTPMRIQFVHAVHVAHAAAPTGRAFSGSLRFLVFLLRVIYVAVHFLCVPIYMNLQETL